MNDHHRSWAEQWDSNPYPESPPADEKKKKGVLRLGSGSSPSWAKKLGGGLEKTKLAASASAKYGKKVGEGLGKSKSAAVASDGVKKVKDSTSAGFQWIKEKCKKGKN